MQQVNNGMTLADFKAIFFWEYVHRLLGRLIGLAFALPLAWFWWRRAIPRGYRLEARRDPRARRAAGRDRLVDGRLGPGRPARGQPHPARHPSAHRAAHLRRDDLGRRSTSSARGAAAASAGDLGAVPARSSSSCSAPMSPGSTPAMPSTPGRRWARTGIRPGRNGCSRPCATSPTIRSPSSSSTAGSPSWSPRSRSGSACAPGGAASGSRRRR